MVQFEYFSKNVFVVLCQSGTIMSKFIKKITKDDYNHASISLDENLNEMWSFARYFAYYRFYGGFVKESMEKGVLKRFKDIQGLVIKFEVGEEKAKKLRDKLNEMFKKQKQYKYDLIGVIFAGFGKKKVRNKKFYCTEFCRSILVDCDIINNDECPKIMHAMDFKNLSNASVVFEGSLHEYYDTINKKSEVWTSLFYC